MKFRFFEIVCLNRKDLIWCDFTHFSHDFKKVSIFFELVLE